MWANVIQEKSRMGPIIGREFHLPAGPSAWSSGYLDGMLNIEIIGVLCIPPSLVSGQECGGRRFRKMRTYAPAADAGSPDCFAGASTIRATPMMTRAATPSSSPRGMKLRNACTAISAAWAKLDHAVKAIRL